MWRLLRAFGYLITGRITKFREALAGNRHVMAATYDKAIQRSEERYETVKGAVAEQIAIKNDRKAQVLELGKKVKFLTQAKEGAQAALQQRINALKGTKTKEEIQADPDFIKHSKAFNDAARDLQAALASMAEKEADLASREAQIAKYKADLEGMKRANETLQAEKHESLADVAIAQQQEAIDNLLAGITTDSTDKDLQDTRAAVKRAKSRAEISRELSGAAKGGYDEYVGTAAQAQAAKELDGLLDWGDTGEKKDLDPAKLPE